jgi:site-specific DNA-cytosine methylase
MRIAVLFDGAGLARLGLEQAGHVCTGYEIDPAKHFLSQHMGSGKCVLGDATQVDLSPFDGIWASPPCQWMSRARTQGKPTSRYATDLLEWAIDLMYRYPDKPVWVENVAPANDFQDWGYPYNAAQFLELPIQNRPRIVGGNYKHPYVYRSYKYNFCIDFDLCPTITASEDKGCATDVRRASRYYGRRLTLEECAYHQGLTIPQQWQAIPSWYTPPPGAYNQDGMVI